MEQYKKCAYVISHFFDESDEVLLVHGLRQVVEDQPVGVADAPDDGVDVVPVLILVKVTQVLELDEPDQI